MELGFNVEVPIKSSRQFHYTIEAKDFNEAYKKIQEIIKNEDPNDDFDAVDDLDEVEYDWNNAIIEKENE